MQSYPAGWEEARSGLHRMETKVTIAGVDYSESEILSVSTSGSLYPSDTLSVGGCVSREINLTVVPKGDIPRMAKIEVYVRPKADGIDTEWLQKGTFYIDTRQTDYSNGRISIHGYDAILMLEQDYPGAVDNGNWPRTMAEVVTEIADRIGITIDSRCSINEFYEMSYATGLTMRNVLQNIASAHGGNWTITDTNELRLVPLLPSYDKANVGMAAMSMDTSPAFSAITGVRLWLDDDEFVFAGDETGRVLEADCLWATKDIAEDVLSVLFGYEYQPFDALGARLDPAAELGDSVLIGGLESVIGYANTEFDALCLSDIGAPADEEVDHEYPYAELSNRKLASKIAQNRSLIEKTEERILLEVESQAGDIANLEVNASEIEARVQSAEGEISVLQQDSGKVRVTVVDQEGTLQTTIDADSWEAIRKNLAGETTSGFWFDFDAGQFVFDGTGEFRSKDGLSYITIEGNELVMYSKDEATGGFLDKIHLGFMSGDSPSSSGGTIDYPYMLLGKASGDVGMIKKFYNGLWIGNSVPKSLSGNFEGMEGASGFFINTMTGKSYAVNGVNMKDVYAGTTDEVVMTSENVSHDGTPLSEVMPVYLTQAEYDARFQAGSIDPDTPYFIQKEV